MSNKKTNNKGLLILLFIIPLCLGILYINWRAFHTINHAGGTFTVVWAYILLAAELYTFMIFTNFSLALIRKDDEKKLSYQNDSLCPEEKVLSEQELKALAKDYSPSVDLFICTLNESLDILTDTALGALNIDYENKKVYLLDDGRRPEVKDLAEKLGCNYITRNNNKGFKAGNINNALKQTSGEFVVIYDADHVPVSTFLDKTVFYFVDKNVSMVQTPQHFFNPDPFQKNLSLEKTLSNEQDLFYRSIQPGLSNYNATVCCGTNFIIRRAHLEEVGGLPEDTITEDSALGMKLEGSGYKVIYVNQPLASGLAPTTFKEYLKQRSRWAKGNLQIFLSFSSIKYFFKLNLIQKYFYTNGMLYFFYAFPRMIFLFAPVLFLIFNISPVVAVVEQIIIFQVSYFVLKILITLLSTKKYRHALFTDVYEAATSVFLCKEIIELLIMPLTFGVVKPKFVVTNKDKSDDGKIDKGILIPLATITGIMLVAHCIGFYKLVFYSPIDVYLNIINPGSIMVNIGWNIYNMGLMYYAIRTIMEKPELRRFVRVPVDIKAKITDGSSSSEVQIVNMSKGGALISVDGIYIDSLKQIINKSNLCLNFEDNTTLNVAPLRTFNSNNDNILIQLKYTDDFYVEKSNTHKIPMINKLINMIYKESDCWEEEKTA